MENKLSEVLKSGQFVKMSNDKYYIVVKKTVI